MIRYDVLLSLNGCIRYGDQALNNCFAGDRICTYPSTSYIRDKIIYDFDRNFCLVYVNCHFPCREKWSVDLVNLL